ncbi:hypothetical protein OAD79_02635 [Flavobacteriales bacterium]|nr:hypothetical protein [Flavobacteriales bacterium]
MKYLKFIVPVIIFISLTSAVKSQDSTRIHDLFYKKQQQSLSLLSSWSVGNLILSPIATKNLFSPSTTNEYFHQMNFSWNLLNVGIAGLGHIIVNKDSKKPWDIQTLHFKMKKAEKSIIINIGLDIAYMITGLLLKNNAKKNNSEYYMNKGYGNSLILQGGYLLIYDAIFLMKLKKILIKKKVNKVGVYK